MLASTIGRQCCSPVCMCGWHHSRCTCASSSIRSTPCKRAAHLDHNRGAVDGDRCDRRCAAPQVQCGPYVWLAPSGVESKESHRLSCCAAALGDSQSDAFCRVEQACIHSCIGGGVQCHSAAAGSNCQDHWHVPLLPLWRPIAAAAAAAATGPAMLLQVAGTCGRPAACRIRRAVS